MKKITITYLEPTEKDIEIPDELYEKLLNQEIKNGCTFDLYTEFVKAGLSHLFVLTDSLNFMKIENSLGDKIWNW